MTLEGRIVQRAAPRAVEGSLAVNINRKTGNALFAENPQIQHFQHVIKLAQVVVDQVNGEIGRLGQWIHAERTGDIESRRGAMCVQVIDLDPAPALEVLGVDRSAKRKLAGSGFIRDAHAEDGRDRKVIRAPGPIDIDDSVPGCVEAQVPPMNGNHAVEHGGQANAAHLGANAHHLSSWGFRRTKRRVPVQIAKSRLHNPALPRACHQIGK